MKIETAYQITPETANEITEISAFLKRNNLPNSEFLLSVLFGNSPTIFITEELYEIFKKEILKCS